MRKTYNASFKNLVQENKQQLLNDKKEMEKIEKLIEQRYSQKS
ncbi:FbpB family small basic protein [Bacillus sp. 165]|nr:FbpB family small basic protein [Bacillus sp. 165]MBO9129902.1 FbpB family small basic protein [Bacillus sp. 165]